MRFAGLAARALALAGMLAGSNSPQGRDDPHPIPIRFHGLLPGNPDPELTGRHAVEFRLYLAPQGGAPVWCETQEPEVRAGHIDVLIGSRNPIPDEIHEATFKWIGASVDGGREIYPRYHVVNVVYASLEEALAARNERRAREAMPGYRAPVPARNCVVRDETETARTWREALEQARVCGADLPDYEAWYEALERAPYEALRARTGHYEWVLPWAYDTASHGRYNRLFRGRFQGCDYMDLSPEKRYVYRVVLRAQAMPDEQTAGAR